MNAVVAIDGVVVPAEDAKVSVYDRGFLYGDAVFEALRTYAGVPFALGEHVRRLASSAARVRIAMPIGEEELAAEIRRVLDAAGEGEKYARIMVTRGKGPLGLDPGLAEKPLRVILVEPLSLPPREVYANGVTLVTVAIRRSVDGTAAAGAKVSNYLTSLLAVREAKEKGGAEALIVDLHGDVVEGASSNVFIARGGRLVTPPEDAGILAGITRAHILECAHRLGIPVTLARIPLPELYGADEVFITSSIRELLCATKVDAHVIGEGRPGPVARALHRALREEVGMGSRPMPWE